MTCPTNCTANYCGKLACPATCKWLPQYRAYQAAKANAAAKAK